MIYVILIEPENPGNIGAIARAMKNFGFSNLVLINPKCDYLCDEAIARSKHAKDILKKAVVGDKRSLNNFDYLIGTTSKIGTDYNIKRSPLKPDELAEKISKLNKKTKIGILFGRESIGLRNDEISKTDFIVTIPTSKRYKALNISVSVAIILYDIHKAIGDNFVDEKITPISKQDKLQITKMIDEILNYIKFKNKFKKRTQEIVWKRIIGKSMLTKREAFALMGFLRKIINLLKKK